jgi:hypothetical protein
LVRRNFEFFRVAGSRVASFFSKQYTQTGEMYQIVTKLPNGPTICIPNGVNKFQMIFFSFQGPPKIYPNLDFWFETEPSGNPGWEASKKLFRRHFHPSFRAR